MTDDESRAAELGEGATRSTPAAMQGRGCLLAGVGMVVLILTPAIGAWVEIPQPVGVGLFLGAVAALLGGAALGLLGAAREPSRTGDEDPHDS